MVSETFTGTLACRYCDCVNQESRQFCTHCGKRLHEPCVRCGTLCPAGEKYCGACGADLAASLKAQAEQCKADLETARKLTSEYHHDQAVTLLESVRKTEHEELAGYARQAGELIRAVFAQRDQHLAEAEAAHQRAKTLADASDCEAALVLLENVPPPLRNEPMGALLEELQSRKDEIASLDADLQLNGTSRRLTPDLLPKIERLLELDHQHAQARQMAARIRDGLLHAARKRLARHGYEDASKLINQIPRAVRTPETEAVHRQAAELAGLWWDLRNSPVVDQTLLAVAERLRQLAPDDLEVAKLNEELQRRAKKPPKAPKFNLPSWAAPPGRTHVECPVEWMTGFERIEVPESVDTAPFAEHPGCFHVACGLALQGLGRAAVTINLLPKDSRGVLGRVARMMHKRPGRTAWGIDLSAGGLKAVRLALEGSQVVVEACDFIEHTKTLSQAINLEEEKALAKKTLDAFLSRNNMKADRLCVGLPGSMAFCRHVKLPPIKLDKIDSVMRHEVRHHVPYDPEDLVWDYQVMNPPGAETPPGEPLEVILLAVKRPQVLAHAKRFQESDLHVDILQNDCLALHNLVAHERFDRADDNAEEDATAAGYETPVALLDIGSDSTNVVVSSPNSVWFRGNGLGGFTFTKALVREFNYTFARAEQQKRAPTEKNPLHEFQKAFAPAFDELVKELDISFTSFAKATGFAKAAGQRNIGRIIGLGGGFQLHGLLRHLRLGR